MNSKVIYISRGRWKGADVHFLTLEEDDITGLYEKRVITITDIIDDIDVLLGRVIHDEKNDIYCGKVFIGNHYSLNLCKFYRSSIKSLVGTMEGIE